MTRRRATARLRMNLLPLLPRPRRAGLLAPLARILALATAATTLCAFAAAAPEAPPLSLDDAIRLALEKNPQIQVQTYGRSIARANWLAQVGAFDPALTFRRSYSEDNTASYYGTTPYLSMTQTDYYSLTLEGLTPWGARYSIGGSAQNPRYASDNYQNHFYSSGVFQLTIAVAILMPAPGAAGPRPPRSGCEPR